MTDDVIKSAFLAMPGVAALLSVDDPQFTILACTGEFAQHGNLPPGSIVGRPIFYPFPENPLFSGESQQLLLKSLRTVVATGQEDMVPEQRYDLADADGNYREKYWRIVNRPVFDSDGRLAAIMHASEEITDPVKNRRREKRIRGFEQAFDLFMDAPQAISVVSGPDLIIDLANRTLLSLLCTDERIIGKPMLDAFPDKKSKGLSKILRKVMEEGIAFENTQARVMLKCNGEEKLHYFHLSCQPFFEMEKEAASGVLIYAHDVTDKVEAIEKVRQKQQQYRTLIEEAPIATALYTGPDLEVRYVNDIMLGYWGRGSEVKGLKVEDAVPKISHDPFLEQLREVYQNGETHCGYAAEATLLADDKPVKAYFNYTFKALRDSYGEIYAIHHTAIDVTRQVLNQQKLEASERKLRELTHTLEEKIYERTSIISQLNETFRHAERTGKFGSYRFNINTGELTYSENLYRLFGYEVGEFEPSAQKFISFVHPEDRDLVILDFENHFLKGESWDHHYRIVRKDAQTIWVRGSTDRFVATDDQTYLIGTLQDISQEKARERQLTENNAKLVEMNRELESFAYISSHDLQEPLRKIQTFASRIIEEERAALSPRTESYFERMMSAAHRMQILIDDLLAYSRTNVEDRNFERVHLSDLVAEISEEIAEDLQVYHAMIETGKLCHVTIIPFQFRQLLHNLIGNALKFSRPEKLPHIYITSEVGTGESFEIKQLEAGQHYCHIRFSDNGIGFQPEFAGKIFEVFQRLHTREKYSGTGIGLAIVRKIVENHDGYIMATGEPNKGATFDIYIPERTV